MKSANHRRRVVVGDIHGELEGFMEILGKAGLIDGEGRWTGEGDILIQTGDVVDRGPASCEALHFLAKLQKEATIAGGGVARLCGNHELMLLQGYYEYADYDDPRAVADELKDEIMNGDILASYTDGERLYTHAGLRSAVREAVIGKTEAVKRGSMPAEIDLVLLSNRINEIFRDSVMNDFTEQHPIFNVGRDRGGSDPVGGIFWCDLSSISPSVEAHLIKQVFGHTPTGKAGVETARGLGLIDVDAGMCRVYGGERVFLEITWGGGLLQHSKNSSGWTATVLDASRN